MSRKCVLSGVISICLLLNWLFGCGMEYENLNDFSECVEKLTSSLQSYNDGWGIDDVKEAEPIDGWSEDDFLSDLQNSYGVRQLVVDNFEKVSHITVDDYWLLCKVTALSEKKFYDKYINSLEQFTNKKYRSLCESYLDGLTKQYDAVDKCFATDGMNANEKREFLNGLKLDYKNGTILRQSVLLEAEYLYDIQVDTSSFFIKLDVDDMIEKAKAGKYSKTMITKIQTKLNESGFDSGVVDGIIGKNTVLAIYDYERKHDMKMDGCISDELIDVLGINEDEKQSWDEYFAQHRKEMDALQEEINRWAGIVA